MSCRQRGEGGTRQRLDIGCVIGAPPRIFEPRHVGQIGQRCSGIEFPDEGRERLAVMAEERPDGGPAQPGADATLRLDESDDLVAAFKAAFGGEGPSYVFDPLWGAPAAAAVEAAVPHATIVNLGQSAGPTSELSSAAVRFKCLSIFGHTNFLVPPDELAEHYRRLVGHAITGEIRLEVERVPLDSVADAWRRQGEGPGAKLVVVP